MNRGDIYRVDLEPTKGREQRGHRPVMIVSPAAFNQHNPPWICPITTRGAGQRLAGLTVPLPASGTKTTGVVLCSQLRALDLRVRNARLVEAAPPAVVDEVVAKLQAILE